MITSIKNAKIQLVRQLLSAKKHRDREQLFVLEGVRLSEEALLSGISVETCFLSSSLTARGKELVDKLASKNIPLEEVSPELMNRVSDTQTSQGIILLCATPVVDFPISPGFILVLDRISDPGNMGTIMRTASGLGVDGIFLTPGSTDPFAPKALRAGLGAQLRLPVKWSHPEEISAFCKECNQPLQILVSTMDCQHKCWDIDLTKPICVVIGSEANGVSDEMLDIADDCVSIPLSSKLESYNAAVAAGILMYEVFRQRKKK